MNRRRSFLLNLNKKSPQNENNVFDDYMNRNNGIDAVVPEDVQDDDLSTITIVPFINAVYKNSYASSDADGGNDELFNDDHHHNSNHHYKTLLKIDPRAMTMMTTTPPTTTVTQLMEIITNDRNNSNYSGEAASLSLFPTTTTTASSTLEWWDFFYANNNNNSITTTTTVAPLQQQHQRDSAAVVWRDPIPYDWRILWLIVSLTIFVAGGVANIITAYVILYTNRSLRRASYVLIAGVAVVDVWMCLLAHPSEVLASACAFVWHVPLPAWWCPVNETLLEIFSCTSILAQMWVAVNRGIAVFAPYFYRTYMRSVRVSINLLLLGALLPSVMFNGPGLFGWLFVHVRNLALGDCKHISPIANVMQLHFALCYATPTAISICIYLAIFMKIVITTSPLVRTTAAALFKRARQFFIHTSSSNSGSESSTTTTISNVSGSPQTSKVGAAAQQHLLPPSSNFNSALRRHAQSATAMFVCVLVFALAIMPPRILLANDLYWRTPVLGIILKLAQRTTFATNPIFYFCFNSELRAAYSKLFGIANWSSTHHQSRRGGHAHANGNAGGNGNSGVSQNNNSNINYYQNNNTSEKHHHQHVAINMTLPSDEGNGGAGERDDFAAYANNNDDATDDGDYDDEEKNCNEDDERTRALSRQQQQHNERQAVYLPLLDNNGGSGNHINGRPTTASFFLSPPHHNNGSMSSPLSSFCSNMSTVLTTT